MNNRSKHQVLVFVFGCFTMFSTLNAYSQNIYNCIEVWKNGVHRVFYEADIDSITIAPPELLPSGYDPYNGHEYVDLGLPSGTKWATCNVGASSPSDIGFYVSWAELAEKSSYDWDNTAYFNHYWNRQTKYCNNSDYGIVDDKTELDPEDDIAYQLWGENWRMPSEEDLQELIDFCSIQWDYETQIFTIRGLNGNTIQFHLTGFKYRGGIEAINPDNGEAAAVAMLWSRTLGESSEKACALSISETGLYEAGYFEFDDFKRCYGCPVRPVSYFDEEELQKEGIVKLWQNGKFTQFAIEETDSIILRTVGDDYKLIYNGHEYVDLGLKSGVMWATKNVGANYPVDNGYYLAWAELDEKNNYSLSTYKYSNGSKYTKYFWDSDDVELFPEDDAAHHHMGANWHTPSYFEFLELYRQCERVRNNNRFNYSGAVGSVFIGPSNATMFLPASGSQEGSMRTYNYYEVGEYWTNHLWLSTAGACALFDNLGGRSGLDAKSRSEGRTVRGVVDFMRMPYLKTSKEISNNHTITIFDSDNNQQNFSFGSSVKLTYNDGILNCKSPTTNASFAVNKGISVCFVEDSNFTLSDVVTLVNAVKAMGATDAAYDLNNNGYNDLNDVDLMVKEIACYQQPEIEKPEITVPSFSNFYLKGSKPTQPHPRKDEYGAWITIDATVTLSNVGEYGIKETGFLISIGNSSQSSVYIKAPLISNSFTISYNYFANTGSNGADVQPYVKLEDGTVLYMKSRYVYVGLEKNYTE